jgi:hypothetical protein
MVHGTWPPPATEPDGERDSPLPKLLHNQQQHDAEKEKEDPLVEQLLSLSLGGTWSEASGITGPRSPAISVPANRENIRVPPTPRQRGAPEPAQTAAAAAKTDDASHGPTAKYVPPHRRKAAVGAAVKQEPATRLESNARVTLVNRVDSAPKLTFVAANAPHASDVDYKSSRSMNALPTTRELHAAIPLRTASSADRPVTTDSVARRLIAGALGIRPPPMSSEQRAAHELKMREAREARQSRRRD